MEAVWVLSGACGTFVCDLGGLEQGIFELSPLRLNSSLME